MRNTAKNPIGLTVSLMKGLLIGRRGTNYFAAKACLDDWKIHKRYWSTKKKYAFCNKITMFGVTKAEIIDDLLTIGFSMDKDLENLVKSLEHKNFH